MSTLRCHDVCKSFNGARALVDVRLALPPSGVTAIIGPNGAGKTTLLNVLTGFVQADSGRCFVGERETTGWQAHRIARMGVARTFQDLRIIRQVTVRENALLARPGQRGETLLGAVLRVGVKREEAEHVSAVDRVLKHVGLLDNAGDAAGELSYGQQKLLTLACCLATEARVLLLDEPVAGVHSALASAILELLRDLGKRGKLVVMVEHDIRAVREVAEHVTVMDAGRVIATGPCKDVLDRPEIMEAYLG